MKKIFFLVGLLLCPLASTLAQVTPDMLEAVSSMIATKISAADTAKKTAVGDSARIADSLRAVQAVKMRTLKEIAISAPRPVYSMDDEVVSYNVAEDETAKGLTALDALQNAPSVEVDIEGNITLRGSDKVEIWLNGYPTHIDGSALKTYLGSLPADALDRIEVIKNPSAKYMVEQGCHIINVVTSAKMRNSQLLVAGLGGSNEPTLRPWASYVFKNERLTANAYLGYSYSHKHSTEESSSTLRRDNGAGGYDTSATTVGSEAYSSRKNTWNCFLNFDYKIDSANSIGLFHFSLLNPSRSSSTSLTDRTDIWPDARHYTYLNSQDDYTLFANSNTNLRWKHKFDNSGHNISVSANHFLFHIGQQYDLVRDYTHLAGLLPAEMQDFNKRRGEHSTTQSLTLNTNYNRPIGLDDELTLRLGVSRQWGDEENDPRFYDELTQEYTRSDTLRYRLKRDSGWGGSMGASWRHKWQSVTLTVGLSGGVRQNEYRIQSLFPDDSQYTYAYLEPSLDISYRTQNMHYFRFKYAFSTSHPGDDNLSASRRYGEDGYSTGNPDLTASYAHDVNLSWNKYFKSSGSLEINSYAKLSANEINLCEDVTDMEDPYLGRIVIVSMPFNTGSSYKFGLESNATYRPAAWLNFRLYANLYRSGYEIDYPKTGIMRSDMTSWNLRLNCWTNIAKRVRVNLSGSYGSPTLSLFSQRKNSASINLGANSEFWGKRISASISISDLFNWNKTENWNTNPYYLTYSSEHRDSRFVSASVTIRLGKMELEYTAHTGAAN